MKRVPLALLALAALLLGAVVGRGIGVKAASQERSIPGETSRRPGIEGREESTGQRVLSEFRMRNREWTRDPAGLRGEMERLNTARLRELASTFGVETNGKLYSSAAAAPYVIMSAALDELHRREGLAAVEWVASWSAGEERKTALYVILNIAARENPFGAKVWHDRYLAEYGRSHIDQFYTFAIEGAKERGADELIKVEELFSKSEERRSSAFKGEFSEGFDFGKLYSVLAGKRDLTQAVHHWAVRDKAAAWEMVSKHLTQEDGNPQHFTSLVTGAITTDGEAEGVKWALERIKELPDDKRRECLRMLDSSQIMTADGAAILLETGSVGDRQILAAASIGRANETETTFLLLDSLPRQDLIAALEEGARANRRVLQSDAKEHYISRVQKRFREASRRYGLTAEEEARIYDFGE
jgi:hypothetical protein